MSSCEVTELEEIIYRDVYFRHKRWSQLPTSPYTVSHAEGLLNNTMSRIPLYEANMIEIGIFQVTYVGPKNVVPDCIDETNITEDEDVQDCTIPIFHVCHLHRKHIRNRQGINPLPRSFGREITKAVANTSQGERMLHSSNGHSIRALCDNNRSFGLLPLHMPFLVCFI